MVEEHEIIWWPATKVADLTRGDRRGANWIREEIEEKLLSMKRGNCCLVAEDQENSHQEREKEKEWLLGVF